MHSIGSIKHARSWITEIAFSPDGERFLTALTNGTVQIWDSRLVKERVGAWERAAKLRARARPVVEELSESAHDLDALIGALKARTTLEPDVAEAALRLLYHRDASHEGMVRRLWRALTPSNGDPHQVAIALSLARGLWRATRHRAEQDARCETLLLVAYHRAGKPEHARWAFEQIGERNRLRAPQLHAVDLAFASMSSADLDDMAQARAHLRALESLLEKHPELRTKRVLQFLNEARAK